MKRILLLLIRIYQAVLSPLLGSNCRFYPTCSHYTYTAIETHGAFYGSYLGMKRILRCNPFNPGGFDPVPGVPLSLDIDDIHMDHHHTDSGVENHHGKQGTIETSSIGTDALPEERGE